MNICFRTYQTEIKNFVFISIRKSGRKLISWCAIFLLGCTEWYLLITSEPVNQRARKALFICICVVNTNTVRILATSYLSTNIISVLFFKLLVNYTLLSANELFWSWTTLLKAVLLLTRILRWNSCNCLRPLYWAYTSCKTNYALSCCCHIIAFPPEPTGKESIIIIAIRCETKHDCHVSAACSKNKTGGLEFMLSQTFWLMS